MIKKFTINFGHYHISFTINTRSLQTALVESHIKLQETEYTYLHHSCVRLIDLHRLLPESTLMILQCKIYR